LEGKNENIALFVFVYRFGIFFVLSNTAREVRLWGLTSALQFSSVNQSQMFNR
jgi:hypothetical protein